MLQVPLLIEYGLTANWQIELEWNAFTNMRRGDGGAVHGIGDVRLGVKRSFMNLHSTDFHAAVGLEVGLPLGDVDKELGEGLLGYEPFFILAKDFPAFRRMQVFSQVGVEFVRRVRNKTDEKSEPPANEFSWNSGLFMPAGRLCFTTELNWNTNRWNRDGTDDQLYFTPGMVLKLPMTWELGVGVAVGLNNRSDSSRIIVKLTHEFGSSDEGKGDDKVKLTSARAAKGRE